MMSSVLAKILAFFGLLQLAIAHPAFQHEGSTTDMDGGRVLNGNFTIGSYSFEGEVFELDATAPGDFDTTTTDIETYGDPDTAAINVLKTGSYNCAAINCKDCVRGSIPKNFCGDVTHGKAPLIRSVRPFDDIICIYFTRLPTPCTRPGKREAFLIKGPRQVGNVYKYLKSRLTHMVCTTEN